MGKLIKLSPKSGVKTLAHELGHELLHRVESIHLSPQQKEAEAEAIGFVVCRFFGLVNLASSNYLLLNKADASMIYASTNRIQSAASEIIKAMLHI